MVTSLGIVPVMWMKLTFDCMVYEFYLSGVILKSKGKKIQIQTAYRTKKRERERERERKRTSKIETQL